MIISVDAEKAFDKMKHPFMNKTLNKMGIEKKYLNIMRSHMTKPHSEKLNIFQFRRSGDRKESPLLPLLVNIVLGVLATRIRQEKEIKLEMNK